MTEPSHSSPSSSSAGCIREDSLGVFTLVALEQLAAGVAASSSYTAVTVLKTHTQHDFASKLLHIISSNKGKNAFSSRNTT
ncbi:unnamed protein product [Colletotrichum noveboracense]|uniref:Uncharacterized protein n=1 Tax=Colletotrichum noveboracense TaxID=2664923 RepID=A0A9W4WS64_9PEZI|nr:unnamed protein product [Colletotrichum noveboracense]